MGRYSGMIRIGGLTTQHSLDNSRSLIGKTINPKSNTFAKLREMDDECTELGYKCSVLSDQLFERAAAEDPEEKWRMRDCVNFNFDEYISRQPGKEELDKLWSQLCAIEREMRQMILDYFEKESGSLN